MNRRAARTDDNQKEIVAAFEMCGLSVALLHRAGEGFPDLVVGYGGLSGLVEVKDGDKPPSARKLTKKQIQFREEWRGDYTVIKDTDEAIAFAEYFRDRANRLMVGEKNA